MSLFSWNTWDIDHETVGWIIFIIYFAVWEAYTASRPGQEMLTDHLRPVFHAAPVTWFIVFGLWLWLGIHFLSPALEQWLSQVVKTG